MFVQFRPVPLSGRRVFFFRILRRYGDHPTNAVKRESSNGGDLTDWQVLRPLWGYLWPHGGDIGLRWRVAGAMSVLFLGKLLNIQVPYLLKRVVEVTEGVTTIPRENVGVNVSHGGFIDVLNGFLDGAIGGTSSLTLVAYLSVGYFLARGGSICMNELRNVIFSRVTESCNRALTLDTLRQFLEEKNDGTFFKEHRVPMLARSMERANRGIRFLVGSILLNLAPTLFEVR
jgi:ABC-type multidrug transport system fused ATPase/permease subunit